MAYRDNAGDVEGDFDDQLDYAWQGGYREGVNAVLDYLEGWGSEPRDIRQAIEDGIL